MARTIEDFDFVRFCLSDTHGIARGRMVPRRHVRKFLDSGVGIFQGILSMGTASQMMAELPHYNGWPNANAMADLSTVHCLPWAGDDQHSVGQVLCRLDNPVDGTPIPHCPRNLLHNQLCRLREMELDIFSSFECEMVISKRSGDQVDGIGFTSFIQLSKMEQLLMKVDDLMKQASVDVETYQTEYSKDQFEMPLQPRHGIKAADDMFIFRNGMKELCRKEGFDVHFMAKPRPVLASNGCHYNHSLCSLSKLNAFTAESNSMSSTCKYWLAGLLKHSRALCALCCPTVNCYRRLHQPWAPSAITWGFDNRDAAFRVKRGKNMEPYIENRIPSGACNPYLVMAGMIAAGLDGVSSKLPLPGEMDTEADALPKTLTEALEALQEDQVIAGAFGKQFMQWFIPTKHDLEINHLKGADVKADDPEAIAKELALYGVNL